MEVNVLEWEEGGGDPSSFDDSDRFEEDSLCSWSSEPESLSNNWRGWKRPPGTQGACGPTISKRFIEERHSVLSLTELSARCVASHIPFELVEQVFPPVPEQLQLRIAFWSFADNEEDIRLYSCLANGSADEFQRGDHLFRNNAVKEPLQIGFHLSASVVMPEPRDVYNVAVTFDRRRISTCNCTCQSTAYWCSHVVAVCLHRIHMSSQVTLRAPVSESLQRLQRDQLQKFAQYLISALPQQILPTAQRLLDELLSAQPTAINTVCGAPDPTAGASATDQTWWYLDERTLHDNINKILIKFCVPAPIVFSDVNYLSTTAPPAAAEWSSLLRPLRGREPEGMWNLLAIVREMFKRGDRNAVPLLQIITDECMACEQILVWWYNTKVSLGVNGSGGGGGGGRGGGGSGGGGGGGGGGAGGNTHASQHACSSLCDEVVSLWRLAVLNPGLAPNERDIFHAQFTHWHLKILEKVSKSRASHNGNVLGGSRGGGGVSSRGGGAGASASNTGTQSPLSGSDTFPGFRPALEACFMDWDDYPIPGVTYNSDTSPAFRCPFTCFRNLENKDGNVTQVNSTKPVLNNELGLTYRLSAAHSAQRIRHRTRQVLPQQKVMRRLKHFFCSDDIDARMRANQTCGDGNRSSVSSEGFCENDDDILNDSLIVVSGFSRNGDTDSQEGNSDSNSSSGGNIIEGNSSSENRSGESSQESSDSAKSHHKYGLCVPNEGSNSVPSTSNNCQDHLVNALQKCSVSGPSDPCRSNGEVVRRSSKDESISSSESQQSGDECNTYFYESKPESSQIRTNGDKDKYYDWNLCSDDRNYGSDLKLQSDSWEVLFARAEGLYAHGHSAEARRLGVRLARELLARPPDLVGRVDQSPGNSSIPARRKGRRHHTILNPTSHRMSVLASATLARCAFLCTVLAETPEHSSLAFRVGLFGLEMARPPASTKPLEVKLANQEAELMTLLRRIPPGPEELCLLRQRAGQLRDGVLRSRGPALLPMTLATFVFDALVVPCIIGKERKSLFTCNGRLPSDELLGFEAAVAALGLKANVSEAEHPLLCEGARRQRGELALSLLSHYKNDPEKLACIMNKLLDRDIHRLVKSPIVSVYYTGNPPIRCNVPPPGCMPEMPIYQMQDQCYGGMSPGPAGVSDWGSRPQSSTSAELDGASGSNSNNSSNAMMMGGAIPAAGGNATNGSVIPPHPPPQPSPSQQGARAKDTHVTRFKGKRAYPSIPNQPSEASAHFMFELAKSVLSKAGGSSSTSLFTQAASAGGGREHHLPHRGLHMAAFQLGLYALGLHNCVSANWLSRTYSSHVSWITGQAMDIGAPAITFLIDTWEGHLTPPEAASIADRASQGCEPALVRAAAELALSCLPHAHALNHNEIQRAVLQCKEQSDQMLERACLTVESAAKGGGVYPEVLFTVAKYWYELYLRHGPPGETDRDTEPEPEPSIMQPMTAIAPLPLTSIAPIGMAPYGFAYQPFHIQFHRPPPLPPPSHHVQVYGYGPVPGPVQYWVAAPVRAAPPQQPPASLPPPGPHHSMPPPPPPLHTMPPPPHHTMPPPPQPPVTVTAPQHSLPPPPSAAVAPQQQQQHRTPPLPRQAQSQQLRALLSAYRVGMLALEAQARRVHDDRPQNKYSRSPPYGENVKWLLRVSKKLGNQYLHQFCVCAVNSVVSPFVLYDLAMEAAHYLSRNNQALFMQNLRGPLAPLVQKCQQMYIQCMHQMLYHLTTSDYEEFANVVVSARTALHLTLEGQTQFKEWLQCIKRSKSCHKDLWAQINSALQANGK